MIRTVIALFVFALVICAMIVFRPFALDDDIARDRLGAPVALDVEVTRAAPPDETALVRATDVALATPQDRTVVQAPRTIDVPRPATDDTELSDMTVNVLAELGFAGVEAVTTPADEQRQSTAQILAGIEAATGQKSVLEERDTLETIVVAALRAGETDDTIDILVNEAAASGQVVVPRILVTSDGRVDTEVMLDNIITQAQIAAGNPAPAIPDRSPDDTEGMEVRVVQRATDEVEARFYTVQPGDSLGAISVRFYGSILYYKDIYRANRALISSPDRIRVGQRLVIPRIEG